jgi:hypothetical protein
MGSNLKLEYLNFQLVRYYGWYSNKMRGQRNKQVESRERAGEPSSKEIEIIDVSEHRPRRPPSKKWRELIKKVWEADPMLCPKCSRAKGQSDILILLKYRTGTLTLWTGWYRRPAV